MPMTFERSVVSLLSSHQSTLGLPVEPAALRTWVGLISSRSLHSSAPSVGCGACRRYYGQTHFTTSSRFSMRTVVETTSLPCSSSRLNRWPATHPSPGNRGQTSAGETVTIENVPPKMRNLLRGGRRTMAKRLPLKRGVEAQV